MSSEFRLEAWWLKSLPYVMLIALDVWFFVARVVEVPAVIRIRFTQ